jgi:hypothetical protein
VFNVGLFVQVLDRRKYFIPAGDPPQAEELDPDENESGQN